MEHRLLNAVMAAAVSAGLFAALSSAVAADPAEAVKVRQLNMKKMGSSMQTIGKFLKGEAGTTSDVQAAAANIVEVASNDPAVLFPQGSAAPVADSAAKPELWQNWPKVQQIWTDLKPASTNLVAAAGSGDKQKIAAAQQAAGKVCASCHDDFRIKKDK